MADATAAVAALTRRSHPNAPLTPHGRRRLCERIDAGRPISHVAAEAGVSRRCLGKWHARWTEHGEAGLQDRSCRPASSPNSTPADIVEKIATLRKTRKWGPARIAAELRTAGVRIAASTVHRVLHRLGLSRLRDLDPPTGEQLRQAKQASCYQRERPGDLIHLDVKKLGRIPNGGGWRAHGKGSAQDRAARRQRVGYSYLHSAVDDLSRLAYTEELPDEQGLTAAGFWRRAAAFFTQHGIMHLHRVLTDNGSCYRSRHFRDAVRGTGSKHKRTRPYRPQTNGKVERFHFTLAREWAYVDRYDSQADRSAALRDFLDYYNYRRPHTAHRGQPPASRVTNLTGQNS